MVNRMDIVAVSSYKDRDGNDKSQFTRIGTAWENKSGWSLTFTALPVPTMSERGLETRCLLMSPQEKQASVPSRQSGGYSAGASKGDPFDSEIPFIMEWR